MVPSFRIGDEFDFISINAKPVGFAHVFHLEYFPDITTADDSLGSLHASSMAPTAIRNRSAGHRPGGRRLRERLVHRHRARAMVSVGPPYCEDLEPARNYDGAGQSTRDTSRTLRLLRVDLKSMVHTGYNPALVALSIGLAVFASYTALDLGARTRRPPRVRAGRGLPAPRSPWGAASGRCTSSACWPSRWACPPPTISA